ncbi:ABC transporter permease [Sporolactobacillus kofuensis]|uniref:ABC transporter permease n=1 Tax=Sporolactobacillus kofuensis TaxID=269672 RepID=A0ABW1W9Y1_9BACL|nr:ABC transporter permease [Sporolactobacillus kofuensis]MCO7175863.1 ABC transporter permease [Sporolactobacillus kofuensis]
MVELNKLWQKRFHDNFQMQLRYWNLIGRNSGLMFFIYAMILIGGFYYKKWLDVLPSHFPGVLIISVVLTLFCAHAPIRTFFQRADSVFLLPIESELKSYFRKSRVYSFMVQSVFLFLIWMISYPLYLQSTGSGADAFIVETAALIAVKAWNINCSWQEQFIEDILPVQLLRTGLTFFFIYFVLSHQSWLVMIVCILVMLLATVFLFYRQAGHSLLNWYRVLESDDRQAMQFLRFANLFTDVPRLRRQMHPHRLVSRLFPIRRFDEDEVFAQLFIKTFIRSDDYLGMYVRLSVIGALIGYFLNIGYASVFVVISIIYLTGLQLLPLWDHPFPQALTGLYPIQESNKRQPFVAIIFNLLLGQSLVLSFAAALGARSLTSFVFFFALSSAVSWLFARVYTKRRITVEK